MHSLAHLTPVQKTRAAEIVRELKRRKREERANYFIPTKPDDVNSFGVPSNDQVAFYNSKAKFRLIKGGNRSGKTEMGIYDAVQFARGLHPVRSLHRKPPVNIRFVAPSLVKNVRILLDKLRQFCPRNELRGGSWSKAWSEQYKTLHWDTGAEIEFLSFEQHVERFAGKDLDAAYSDEHGAVRYFRENMARLSDRNGYYVQTFTPDQGSATWEKRVFADLQREGFSFEQFNFSIFGNPHLSQEGVEQFKASLGGDENLEKIKLYGEYAALAGAVYPMFRRDLHVIPEREIPEHWYRMFGIDPHLKKASGMLWCTITPEGDMILYRYANKFLTVPDLKAYIRTKSDGEKFGLMLGDEAMGGDGLNIFGQKSVIAQLNEGNDRLPIIGTNQASDKSFAAGVMKLRDMMTPDAITRKPKFFIMESYKGHSNIDLIDEFYDYQFLPDEAADEKTFRERVRKIADEGPDLARYFAMSKPMQNNKPIQSAIGDNW